MREGFINVFKPCGYSSHDVVNDIRKIFSTRAVGHMGTLDPDACGVLPIAMGRATRLIPYVEGTTKVYRAELIMGIATDTLDNSGVIQCVVDASQVTYSELKNTLMSFIGVYEQIPPMYSSKKIGGKRLYDIARSGGVVDRQPNVVAITSIVLHDIHIEQQIAVAVFDVTCSKGTYIRSLCADVGARMGLPSCMGFLLRLASGPFILPNSNSLAEIR
ncbi:MAG: tRNA pseudouridine(55) synthase TruB, partial [bacterium]|nr:tRNA pseudouridine(55) synthase TruB [bacterium]